MVRLYDYLPSGNGYKIRLLLTQLGVAYERTEVDILTGASQTPTFLRMNPNGKIPVVTLEDGTALAESNAILFYFADGTPLLPGDRLQRAQVLQWMCFEQYSHEPNIATVRFWLTHGGLTDERRALLDSKYTLGNAALQVMETHLHDQLFFVAAQYSIADIALYAYTHVAEEGGFDLTPYPAVREWLSRVQQQPGYIPITQG